MKKLIRNAKGMIELGKIDQSSEEYYEIDGDTIRLEKKPGRTLMTCTCEVCTRNINEKNILCSRKIASILYTAQDPGLKKLIRENLEYVKDCEKLGVDIDINVFICLLNDLKKFI